MRVAVFGLGYVGSVCTGCLARDGHRVIGIDINLEKVEAVRRGESPVLEPGLSELIAAGVRSGRIEATSDAAYGVDRSELLLVCVGTPSQPNGSLELKYVERVCADIGRALAARESYAVVVVRSTILPGTARERLIPLLESESGREAGQDFGFCVSPEFLREGSALRDYDRPPYTVIGELDRRSGEGVAQLYAGIGAPLYRLPLGAAEMVKYASNAFHALKVAFANEIGNLCQAQGIDSHRVMDVFVQDVKLNLSAAYLRPGFAFGGSCLGKDLRALLYASRRRDVRAPVLESILPSNQLHIQKAIEMLLAEGRRRVALIGLSFKARTDDLRESPAVELAERLIGKGFDLRIYDGEVSLGRLHGSNRAFIAQALPHIGSLLLPSLEEAVGWAETVVVAKPFPTEEQQRLVSLLRADQVLVDLVRLDDGELSRFEGEYQGICW